MKKCFSILVALLLALAPLGMCGAETAKVQENGMLWAVEPLPEKTKLTVAYLSNSTAEALTYVADELGWLEKCNLEVEMVYFAGGPAQMEASTSWDVGTTGIGGMITGLLNYDIRCLGVVSLDRGLYQAFFARKDSDVVAAGTGHTDVEGLYGTAETWKGKSILTATGTANQYTLYNTLKAFGLGLSDVNVINMDIATVPTAFLAGEGDLAGIQGLNIQDPVFQGEDSQYVMVSSDQMLKCGLPVNYVCTGSAWESKQDAVKVWLELAMMAGEYTNQHLEDVSEMMVDMFALDGYETQAADNLILIRDNPFISVEDNHGFFTQKDEHGRLVAEAQIYDAMTGYVEMGNYTQDQLDRLLEKPVFLSDPIQAIFEGR